MVFPIRFENLIENLLFCPPTVQLEDCLIPKIVYILKDRRNILIQKSFHLKKKKIVIKNGFEILLVASGVFKFYELGKCVLYYIPVTKTHSPTNYYN